MDKNLRIRKIDVYMLIQTLNELYDKGIDYVDLVACEGESEDQDTLGLVFSKAYVSEEYMETYESFFDNSIKNDENLSAAKIETKLTDEDLDQLL